ncbi:MAG: hypothetical protein LC749_23030, partial [Actinobacteria bacterium]|nr:hypothetical protein [Actinomycetota bacterium]
MNAKRLAIAVLVFGAIFVPVSAAAQSGAVTPAAPATDAGRNTPAGGQGTSAAPPGDALGRLIQPLLNTVFPQNDSTAPANNAGLAPAGGDAATKPSDPAKGADSASLQSPNVTHAGPPISSTPHNAATGRPLTNAAGAPPGGDGSSVVSACTVSNTSTNPGVLGLLAAQYQGGPIQTMTCVPAAVVGGNGSSVVSACTVSNTFTNPGVLGLLAAQYQSGPIQTMTCMPAAVVGGGPAGRSSG